jgi:hypothetical protein
MGKVNFSLAHIIGAAVDLLLKVLVVVSRIFAGLPGAAPVLILPFPFLILFYFFSVRRFRKSTAWFLAALALIFSLFSLPGVSVLRLEADQARLILPDRTSWLVSDRERLNRTFFEEMETVDYLVAPSPIITSRKGFYALPDGLNFKKMTIGEWTIDIQRSITFKYLDREWDLGDTLLKPYETIYVVARGKKAFQFSVKKYESPFGRCSTELKIIYLKFRLLVG